MNPSPAEMTEHLAETLQPWEPAGIRTVLVWGSTIDVLAGTLAPRESNDIDVMVICDNSAKVALTQVGLHGMPVLQSRAGHARYDCSLLDLGYVQAAITSGRWTVSRAVRDGPVLRDDGTLQELRQATSILEPFENTMWQDWMGQARKLLPKAAQLIERGDYGYAELLIRNAYELLAYALIARIEGGPPTPTSFAALAARHASQEPVLANLARLLMVDSMEVATVQSRWLELSELLSA